MQNFQTPSFPAYMNNFKSDPQKTYQIIEKIGEGTYASVYKAFNKLNDTLVAIKIFPSNTDEYAYQNEIEFLEKLNHPFIVKMFDVYATAEEIWVILEYCQLGSLYSVINITGETLSEPEISFVCYSILSALDYLHKQDKIHRDVKLANILVNSFGQVKLTDFGISSKNPQADSFLGSLLWMAPEVISGKSYDSSVDIWALGICVIEMAEGNAPFHHLHQVRAKYAIQNKPQTQFTDPALFSEELNDFLANCLQLAPEKRMNTEELLRHPFILKYKGDITNIRRRFCQQTIPKLEEYKKNIIIRGNSDSFKILEGEDLSEERAFQDNSQVAPADSYNNSVIEHPSYEKSEANLTCIEKSGDNIEENDSLYDNKEHVSTYSNIKYAIQCLQSDKNEAEVPPKDFSSPLREADSVFSNMHPHARAMSVENRQVISPLLKVDNNKKRNGGYTDKHTQSAIENLQTEGRESRKETLESIGRTNSSPVQSKQKVLRPKMYKNPNESNFVVKHKISETVLATNLNQSIDTETTLNPISLDRQKHETFQGINGLMQEINISGGGARSLNKNQASASSKNFSVSTASGSKPGSTCFKSGMHTSNSSLANKDNMAMKFGCVEAMGNSYNKGSKMNEQGSKAEMEYRRIKLEQMMKKELDDIEMKYKSMLKNLGKET